MSFLFLYKNILKPIIGLLFICFLLSSTIGKANAAYECSLTPRTLKVGEVAIYNTKDIPIAQKTLFLLQILRSSNGDIVAETEVNIGPNEQFQQNIGPFSTSETFEVRLKNKNDGNPTCSITFDVSGTSIPPQSNLSLTRLTTNPTDKDRLEVRYENMDNGNCFVAYYNKNGTFIHPASQDIHQPCSSDPNAYISFIASATNNYSLFFEPQPLGTYELYAKSFKQECNLFGFSCNWKQVDQSNTLRFDISSSTSISDYNLLLAINPSSGKATDNFTASIEFKKADNSPVPNAQIHLEGVGTQLGTRTTDNFGKASIVFSFKNDPPNLTKGIYTINAYTVIGANRYSANSPLEITEDKSTSVLTSSGCKPGDKNCTLAGGIDCNIDDGKPGIPAQAEKRGILTAIGCIPTEPTELVKGISKFITGAAGGIALLLMVIGALQMVTSGGNPEGVKAGQERLTSAAIGLLFIILSVTLLRIIGVDILNIPGFS